MGKLSSRYAQALFHSSMQAGKGYRQRYGQLLDELSKGLCTSDELKQFLLAPHVSPMRKKEFLSSIYTDTGDRSFLNFLSILVDKKRFNLIKYIFEDYRRIDETEQHIVEVLVDSAFPLDEETTGKIAAVFKKKTGAPDVRVRVQINPALIGGIRASIGSSIYDGTIQSTLNRLSGSLK
jgi:F-type H+-transporting ATPase subunit delta